MRSIFRELTSRKPHVNNVIIKTNNFILLAFKCNKGMIKLKIDHPTESKSVIIKT